MIGMFLFFGQIPGKSGPRRLLKVCAGGTFGEMGFYLRTPQVFRAVTREPCHLHSLDREGMATMQVRVIVIVVSLLLVDLRIPIAHALWRSLLGDVLSRKECRCRSSPLAYAWLLTMT